MSTARLLTCAAIAAVLSLAGSTPASATIVNPPKYRDAFGDTVCGISAHVVIVADNPIIETGRRTATDEPVSIDTGHLVVHFTNLANGHWMEDGFSGPASVVSSVLNADGTVSKRVVFSGTKRQFSAWDGARVVDRGRLVVDYVIQDDEVLSRTTVSQVGDFPIASGAVGFCDFVSAHLS
jgi:hypothetical protein